jgi:hypothetical protein
MASNFRNPPGDGDYLALNSHSLLLLYIAHELPAEQRKQLETRVANEPALQAELENLRALMDASDSSIGSADAAGRDLASEAAAMRQASRAIRQWTVQRAIKKPAEVQYHRRFGWRSLSAAAAILFVVGYVGWWGMSPVAPPSHPHSALLSEADKFDLLTESFDQSSLAEPFDTQVASAYSGIDDLDDGFDSQLLSLRRSSNLQ